MTRRTWHDDYWHTYQTNTILSDPPPRAPRVWPREVVGVTVVVGVFVVVLAAILFWK